ncbi:MAG: 8-amino-7-oxononanoate synthase [bacterium]|nr:8-amino-7-oxononanoate synthase [bacterium]
MTLLTKTPPDLERKIYQIEQRDGIFIVIDGQNYLDFSSNDYLGLATHPLMKKATIQAIQQYGTGSTASRLLSGTYNLHNKLETDIAIFKHKEAALVFNSGYQANLGLVRTLFNKNDVIFSDKLNHASIIDGLKLGEAKYLRFKHNNIEDLEWLLKKERKKFDRALVITETVFSMDGDIAPLTDIIALKKQYNLEIMVDEAHAVGIETPQEIDYIMGTFSKGLGSFGAYFACSQEIKTYLINKCRSFIFTTALPPGVIAANITALEILTSEKERTLKLKKNTEYFRNELKKQGLLPLGETQIIPIIIGSEAKALKVANKMRKLGFWVSPIRYPTVAKNQARLRFSLSFNHTKEMLAEVIKASYLLKE